MPRRASVNSFGYGGTNGHAILEDPAQYRKVSSACIQNVSSNQWQVFTVSGKDELATRSMMSKLRDYLQNKTILNEGVFLMDLAHTLNHRRSKFAWRASMTASDKTSLLSALGSPNTLVCKSDEKPRLGFVFTGQGAQWYAMGRELITTYSVFKKSILEAEKILSDFGCHWSLSGRIGPHRLTPSDLSCETA